MRILRSGLLALAAVALAGPASAATKIIVGYTPAISVAQLFVGKDEGIFAKHGLDVELLPGNGVVMVSGVVSDSMEISSPTVPTLLQAIDSGLDLVAIAGDNLMSQKKEEYSVVVRNGLTLTKASDYVGKKVAVSTIGAFLHVLFVEWLNENGVDPRKVSFVEVGFPQMNDVLKSGSIDAAIAVEPFVSRMVKAGTGHATSEFVKAFPNGFPVAVFMAKRKWVDANAQTVRAFRAALAETLEFMAKNPDKVSGPIIKYLKLPPEVVASTQVPDLTVDVKAESLAEWIRIMKSQNLVKGNLDPAKLIWK
jgi:NitT/TauT family transport system substrate-binding protein